MKAVSRITFKLHQIKTMKKIVIKFGLISGLLISGFMALSFLVLDGGTNIVTGEIIGFSSMILAFSLIIVAMRKFSKEARNGLIKFKDAFMIGLYISLITSTLYVVCWMAISAANPQIVENMKQMYMDQITQSELPEPEKTEELEKRKKMFDDYEQPLVKVAYTYMEILPVGLLITLIAAGVFHRLSVRKIRAGYAGTES